MSGPKHWDALNQVAWAVNSARNSVISAGDFIYGKLADNARMDASRAKRLLWEQREQIAKLLGAAPALFEAAERLAALDDGPNGGRSFPSADDCEFARTALAKARGEPSA